MEPISTALAGFALVKASVDGIKSAISTAKDLGVIANDIDNLLNGQAETQAASNKKSGVSLADQLGVKTVAKELIEARIAAENVAEIRRLVDHRFGSGTWQTILDERAKRIREVKEAQLQARRAQAVRQAEIENMIKTGAMVVCVLAVAIGLLLFAVSSAF
tara:strand:- start:880 stop:1362 length:483 start_codon:yes stop_codon:yes gene_type:complete